jgi:hypothetical protein
MSRIFVIYDRSQGNGKEQGDAASYMEAPNRIEQAMGITPANVPEASVTEAISEDLERQEVCLKDLHIDRAYLSSHLVRERSDDLQVYCKAWMLHPGSRPFYN